MLEAVVLHWDECWWGLGANPSLWICLIRDPEAACLPEQTLIYSYGLNFFLKRFRHDHNGLMTGPIRTGRWCVFFTERHVDSLPFCPLNLRRGRFASPAQSGNQTALGICIWRGKLIVSRLRRDKGGRSVVLEGVWSIQAILLAWMRASTHQTSWMKISMYVRLGKALECSTSYPWNLSFVMLLLSVKEILHLEQPTVN